MSTKIGNLWQLEDAIMRTPSSILKEQASALGPQTKGLVEAEVKTQKETGDRISHSFTLVAPALDNYRYTLFTISHSIALYPIFVHPDSSRVGQKQQPLNTEEEFVEWLRNVLGSAQTKKIVAALVSQST